MAEVSREQSALRIQAQFCGAMGSPLYGHLLERAANGDDGGTVLELLAARPADENFLATLVVLRLMASVHRLALGDAAPALAAHYPSCGGDGNIAKAWDSFAATVREHSGTIASELSAHLQTNEVMRAATLLGGYLTIAQRFGLPLRLLEIGASAGLGLRWDRYCYQHRAWRWGPSTSLLRFTDCYENELPFPRDLAIEISERSGCDLDPIDPTHEAGRQKLLSFLWADQIARISRLSIACEMARALPVSIDRARASIWLADRLAAARPGVTTVVFHTVVWQYLERSERETVRATLAAAGKRATKNAPLAYLTLEPTPTGTGRVMLRLWPGDIDVQLARGSLHGDTITWMANASIASASKSP